MWFNSGCEAFLIKSVSGRTRDTFSLTNGINHWCGEFDHASLVVKFKDENPSLEGTDELVLGKIRSLFSPVSKNVSRKCVKGDRDTMTIIVSSGLGITSCSLTLCLQLSSPRTLYQDFTVNVLGLLKCFHAREKRLISIVESKDIELEEYRQEGVELKRSGIVTSPFKYEDFLQEHRPSVTHCDAVILDDVLLSQLPEYQPTVKMKIEVEVPSTSVPSSTDQDTIKKPKVEMIGLQYTTETDDVCEIKQEYVEPKKRKLPPRSFLS